MGLVVLSVQLSLAVFESFFVIGLLVMGLPGVEVLFVWLFRPVQVFGVLVTLLVVLSTRLLEIVVTGSGPIELLVIHLTISKVSSWHAILLCKIELRLLEAAHWLTVLAIVVIPLLITGVIFFILFASFLLLLAFLPLFLFLLLLLGLFLLLFLWFLLRGLFLLLAFLFLLGSLLLLLLLLSTVFLFPLHTVAFSTHFIATVPDLTLFLVPFSF